MERLPHENYIRFLITNGLDLEETNEHLAEMNLPICPVDEDGKSEYWDDQYTFLHDAKVPKQIKNFWNKQAKKKLPMNFLSYMNIVGLKEVWLYNIGKNRYFETALDLLSDEDMSLTFRAAIAMKCPVDEICALINGRFGLPVPKESVEIISKYFFNPRIMSRKAWKSYLQGLNGTEQVILYKAFTGKYAEVRAELGLPNRISVSEHYQQMHIYAMEKFNTFRLSRDPNSAMQALKWAGLAMSSGDKYEKLKLGDATDFSKDLQMEFEFVETSFPTIGQENLDELHNQSTSADHVENDNATQK